MSFGLTLDGRATTKYWTMCNGSLKMLVSWFKKRTDKSEPRLIRLLELRHDLGHTKACYVLAYLNSDVGAHLHIAVARFVFAFKTT